MSTQYINYVFTGNTTSLDSSVLRSQKMFTDLTNSTNRSTSMLGIGVNKISSAMNGLLMTARVLTGVFASGAFLGSAINKSMNFIETINMFQVSMKDTIGVAQEFQDTMSEKFGLDPQVLMKAQAEFNLLTGSMGVVTETSSKMSEGLTKVGVDIASLWNIDVDVAMGKLASGMVGYSRALRDVGIDVSVNALKFEAQSQGITANINTMSQATKMQLRYAAIVRQANAAIGDFSRTIEQPANQSRILGEQMDMVSRHIGDIFLPTVAAVLPYLNAFAMVLNTALKALAVFAGYTGLEDSAIANADLSNGMADFGDEADSAATGVGKVAKEVDNLMTGMDELHKIALPTASSGSGSGGTGSDYTIKIPEVDNSMEQTTMRAIAMAKDIQDAFMAIDFSRLITSFFDFKFSLGNVTQLGKDFYSYVLQPFASWSIGTGIPLFFDAMTTFNLTVVPALSKYMPTLGKFNTEFLQPIGEWTLGTALPSLFTDFGNFLTKIQPNVDDIVGSLGDFWTGFLKPIGNWVVDTGVPGTLDAIAIFMTGIDPVIDVVADGLKKAWDSFFEPIATWTVTTALPTVATWFADVGDFLVKNPDFAGSLSNIVATLVILKGVSLVVTGGMAFIEFIKGLAAVKGIASIIELFKSMGKLGKIDVGSVIPKTTTASGTPNTITSSYITSAYVTTAFVTTMYVTTMIGGNNSGIPSAGSPSTGTPALPSGNAATGALPSGSSSVPVVPVQPYRQWNGFPTTQDQLPSGKYELPSGEAYKPSSTNPADMKDVTPKSSSGVLNAILGFVSTNLPKIALAGEFAGLATLTGDVHHISQSKLGDTSSSAYTDGASIQGFFNSNFATNFWNGLTALTAPKDTGTSGSAPTSMNSASGSYADEKQQEIQAKNTEEVAKAARTQEILKAAMNGTLAELAPYNSGVNTQTKVFEDLRSQMDRNLQITNLLTGGSGTLSGSLFDLGGKTDEVTGGFNFLKGGADSASKGIEGTHTTMTTLLLPTMKGAKTTIDDSTFGMTTAFGNMSTNASQHALLTSGALGRLGTDSKTNLSTWGTSVSTNAKSAATSMFDHTNTGVRDTTPLYSQFANSITGKMLVTASNVRSAMISIVRSISFLPTSTAPEVVATSMNRLYTNVIDHLPMFAGGGIFNKATAGIVGEAGAEAVIPLSQGKLQKYFAPIMQGTGNQDALVAKVASAVVSGFSTALQNQAQTERPTVVNLDGKVIYSNQQKVAAKRGIDFGMGVFAK